MILVDTSIWIDHLRHDNPSLAALLEADAVLIHPFVAGELAMGNLQPREMTLGGLQRLPHATAATHREVLQFIERHRLFGLGMGYLDAHLLASVMITDSATLWTRDRALHAAAEKLGVAHVPSI